MENNIGLSACVINGNDKKIEIESGIAENTKMIHEEFREETKEIETKEEAEQFAQETGTHFYIAGTDKARDNIEKNVDKEVTTNKYSNSRYASRNPGEGIER